MHATGAGCDVVYRLMEMGNLFDNCHHLFTDNLFTTCATASYLLERGTLLTGTMRRKQLQHIPNEIVAAKPKVGVKVYYRKERYLAMSYRQNNLKASLLLCYQFFVGHLMFHIGKRQTKQFQQ